MSKIKICGITKFEDALNAANLGANFIGFCFIKESQKKVSEKAAADIVSKMPPFVSAVAVFENEEKKDIDKTLKKTAMKGIQFNGSENPQICENYKKEGLKVFKFQKLQSDADLSQIEIFIGRVDYFILDITSHSEEGAQVNNFEIAKKAIDLGISCFISGSIGIENIKETLNKLNPFGFDFDSEIERLPKRKDYDKMSKAIKLAHGLKI